MATACLGREHVVLSRYSASSCFRCHRVSSHGYTLRGTRTTLQWQCRSTEQEQSANCFRTLLKRPCSAIRAVCFQLVTGEDFAVTAEGRELRIGLNLDPFMIHETFLYLTETAFGSHPCRVVSATYFHGGNMHGFRNQFAKLRSVEPDCGLLPTGHVGLC